MPDINFSKMHGLGNDFVVFDAVSAPLVLESARARWVADRHLGVGCDQILLVEPAPSVERQTNATADFGYRIFNADGSESGQCGNGARCVAHFIVERGLSTKSTLRLATREGHIEVEALGGEQYRAALGMPSFQPADVPLQGFEEATCYRLHDVAGQVIEFDALSVGNPHAVIDVDSIETADVATLGPALESHSAFPARVNVSFAETCARDHLRLRVHERGAGQTLACGSAAAAAACSGIRRGRLDAAVTVELPGGKACVEWAGSGAPVYLSGPATHVFDGTIATNWGY